jgi:cytoskeleton protein RodZ
MSEFGAHLKQAREQRGISLRQIATATKISMGALEALERNDFSRLPGGIFSRAFVRAYALEVGLDPEQTVQDFLVEYDKHGDHVDELAAPEVTADDRAFLERQRRAARLLRYISIGVVLIIIALVIAWKVSSARGESGGSTPVASSDAPAPAVEIPSAPPPAPVATPPAAATDAGAPAAPAPVPAETSPSDGSDSVRVHLQVTGESWVRITVDGVLRTERTLQAGETRDTAAGREVFLQVGNAGAVKWSINGRPAKALGRPGEMAEVRLTRANMATFLQGP